MQSLGWFLVIGSFSRRKKVDKMEKIIFYVSDCCNVESNADYMVCSCCGEHCEIVVDDSMVKN